MTPNHALYNSEEFSRRGQEIYDRDVHPALRPEDEDKFVAIDIESGSYELDRDDFTATERLLTRQPHAQIWLARVGPERPTESVWHSHAEPLHGDRDVQRPLRNDDQVAGAKLGSSTAGNREEAVDKAEADRQEIWKTLDQEKFRVRRRMSEKYKTDFDRPK